MKDKSKKKEGAHSRKVQVGKDSPCDETQVTNSGIFRAKWGTMGDGRRGGSRAGGGEREGEGWGGRQQVGATQRRPLGGSVPESSRGTGSGPLRGAYLQDPGLVGSLTSLL